MSARRVPLVLAAAALALAATACARAPGKPDRLRLGRARTDSTPGSCPPIAGTFAHEENDLAHVVNRLLPYEARQQPWWTVSISGDSDSALVVAIRRVDDSRDTVTITNRGAYHCPDGWLEPREAGEILRGVPYDAAGNKANRDEFAIAMDGDGALVGRRTALTWDEFTVWCGDGCRGIPLPWTYREHVVWSSLRPPTTDRPPAPRLSATDRRLADEERRLEWGDPLEDAGTSPRGRASRDEALRRAAARERAIEEGLPVP